MTDRQNTQIVFTCRLNPSGHSYVLVIPPLGIAGEKVQLESKYLSGKKHCVHCQATGKHKMISKLATKSFQLLRLIARNPNFSRQKVLYFDVSRLSRQSRLHEVICIYVFRHTTHCSRSVIKYQQKNDKHGSLKACWPKRELREAWTG